MAFKFAEIYFGSVSSGTKSIPEGFTSGFVFNSGSVDITITGKTGTFILSPNEKLYFQAVGKPYATVEIVATSGSAKFGYIKA